MSRPFRLVSADETLAQLHELTQQALRICELLGKTTRERDELATELSLMKDNPETHPEKFSPKSLSLAVHYNFRKALSRLEPSVKKTSVLNGQSLETFLETLEDNWLIVRLYVESDLSALYVVVAEKAIPECRTYSFAVLPSETEALGKWSLDEGVQ